jgi:DNA-binding transcriptional ArsR family regulator
MEDQRPPAAQALYEDDLCFNIADWLYLRVGGRVRPASEQLLERIADRLKAMADPMRLHILHVLQGGDRCVNDILGQVGGSQANVSKHLSVLRRAGLVECRREGVNVYYRIDDPTVFSICETVCNSLERQVNAEKQEIEQGRAAMLAGER